MFSYAPLDAEVAGLRDLTPSLRRVTLRGPQLTGVAPTCLDRRLKLVLPRTAADRCPDLPRSGEWFDVWRSLPDDTRPALRTYTPSGVRPEVGELDIDVVRHGSTGPAGRWIESVQVGSPIVVVAPLADFPGIDDIGLAWRPGRARQVLLVGDETAGPAIANIASSLDPAATGTVLLELPTSADAAATALTCPPGIDVRLLARDDAPHGQLLEEAVHALAWPPHPEAQAAAATLEADDDSPLWEEAPALPDDDPDADHYAWIAGESGVVTRIRRHLVNERGCRRDRIAFMGYWRHGRAEC